MAPKFTFAPDLLEDEVDETLRGAVSTSCGLPFASPPHVSFEREFGGLNCGTAEQESS